jgi:hypothetical protein
MSDPTLVTQIITTGTATVSVIGSDGSGKSKIMSAEEVRTAGEAQQTLVSGTNIKTINSTSLLGSGDVTIASGGTFTDVIRSTDGNLSAAVNTWYHWDISGLTADRTLTLPATAVVGDRVAITITTGDDAYEVLITAASGDTLAAIAGGTEWSRLFITGEVVILRCIVANTTWIVEYDGRYLESCELFGTATTSYVLDAVTKFSLGGSRNDGMTIGTNEIIPRRTGLFVVTAENVFSNTRNGVTVLLTTFHTIGTTTYAGGTTRTIRSVKSTNLTSADNSFATTPREVIVSNLSNAFALWYYFNLSSGGNYYTIEEERPSLRVRRVA